MKRALTMLVFCAMTALAADISGSWKGTAEFNGTPIERTFVFKVDGNKLTGETSSQMAGKSTITNGTIEGDAIDFTIVATIQGNEITLHFKGKASGDEIRLDATAEGMENAISYVLKRTS